MWGRACNVEVPVFSNSVSKVAAITLLLALCCPGLGLGQANPGTTWRDYTKMWLSGGRDCWGWWPHSLTHTGNLYLLKNHRKFCNFIKIISKSWNPEATADNVRGLISWVFTCTQVPLGQGWEASWPQNRALEVEGPERGCQLDFFWVFLIGPGLQLKLSSFELSGSAHLAIGIWGGTNINWIKLSNIM